MAKCNIDCMSWQIDPHGKHSVREWEINIDAKVWPCCKFVVDAFPKLKDELRRDKVFRELHRSDPTWNSLKHHTLEEIQNHWFYQEYIHPTGWNSDKPPPICANYCGTNLRDGNHSVQNLSVTK